MDVLYMLSTVQSWALTRNLKLRVSIEDAELWVGGIWVLYLSPHAFFFIWRTTFMYLLFICTNIVYFIETTNKNTSPLCRSYN